MQIRVEKSRFFPAFLILIYPPHRHPPAARIQDPGAGLFSPQRCLPCRQSQPAFIRNRDQMRIWKSNSVCIKHLFDGKAHSALHFPLLHRLYLADNSDIDTRFSQIGNSLHKRRFLNELCIFLRILVDCSFQKLYDLAGIRLIGSGNGNRGHRSSLVIVDDTGDGSVWMMIWSPLAERR